MVKSDSVKLDNQAQVFRALAHPARLAFLELLQEGPRCVCEMAKVLGLSKSIASKHLSQLRQVGLLSQERQGTQVFCTLKAPCVLELKECTYSATLEEQRRRLNIGKTE